MYTIRCDEMYKYCLYIGILLFLHTCPIVLIASHLIVSSSSRGRSSSCSNSSGSTIFLFLYISLSIFFHWSAFCYFFSPNISTSANVRLNVHQIFYFLQSITLNDKVLSCLLFTTQQTIHRSTVKTLATSEFHGIGSTLEQPGQYPLLYIPSPPRYSCFYTASYVLLFFYLHINSIAFRAFPVVHLTTDVICIHPLDSRKVKPHFPEIFCELYKLVLTHTLSLVSSDYVLKITACKPLAFYYIVYKCQRYFHVPSFHCLCSYFPLQCDRWCVNWCIQNLSPSIILYLLVAVCNNFLFYSFVHTTRAVAP